MAFKYVKRLKEYCARYYYARQFQRAKKINCISIEMEKLAIGSVRDFNGGGLQEVRQGVCMPKRDRETPRQSLRYVFLNLNTFMGTPRHTQTYSSKKQIRNNINIGTRLNNNNSCAWSGAHCTLQTYILHMYLGCVEYYQL